MLKIGLTGGIGSGKSLVAQLFAEEGAIIIDADQIAHQITQPNQPAYQAIIQHFGENIVDEQQKLNRKKLREIIFLDFNERKWLEALLHPLILQQMVQEADAAQTDYCILVIPLLVEANARSYVDRVCVVDCSEELQIKRTRDRDQSPADNIKQIMATQATRSQRLAIADDVIHNDQDIAYLRTQVRKLHLYYRQLSKEDGFY